MRKVSALDWLRIQSDYIKTGARYAALAEKYGVPLSTLKKKAAIYKWAEKRAAVLSGAEVWVEPELPPEEPEPEEAVPEEPELPPPPPEWENTIGIVRTECGRAQFERLVDEMAWRIEDAIRTVSSNDAASIKLLVTALKDLRDLKHYNRTELDIEEQQARIAKLKSDTRIVDVDDNGGGVIFMPTMAARPLPPDEEQR